MWIAALTLKKKTRWGIRRSLHGYGWYAANYNDDEVIYAMGYGGQFIVIIHAKELVVVSTHNSEIPDGLDQQIDFISETLPLVLNKY